MADSNSRTLAKVPRRMRRSVSKPKKRSTWFNQLALGGSEVHVVAGMTRKPALHFGHLVSSVVVHHQMNVELLGNIFLNALQETQEFLMPVTAVAGADDFAGGHIESSEQRGGSIADVIVGLPRGHAGPEREHGPGSIQCLHLTLLIHTQHQRAFGWV